MTSLDGIGVEIPLEIQNSESIEKEMKEKLTDLDRGILLLNDTIISHDKKHEYSKIVQDLFLQNTETELKKEMYKKSKKRWNRATTSGEVLTLLSLSISTGLDFFDIFYNEKENWQFQVRRVIAIIALAMLIIAGVFTFVCYCVSIFHGRKYKKISKLNLEDLDSINKLMMILKVWGKLENQKEHDTVCEREINCCFESIQQLPKSIKNEKLPSKSRLASMTIHLLDDDHPIKMAASQISSEDSFSPRNSISFKDEGQQSSMIDDNNERIGYNEDCFENRCKQLKYKMNGIKIKNLHVKNEDTIRKIPLRF